MMNVMATGPSHRQSTLGPGESQPTKLYFRQLQVEDLDELKELHEEMFPVRYSLGFYEAVVRGYMVGTREPLLTLVALEQPPPPSRKEDAACQMCHCNEGSRSHKLCGRQAFGAVCAYGPRSADRSSSYSDEDLEKSSCGMREEEEYDESEPNVLGRNGGWLRHRRGRIVGFIIAQMVETDKCGDPDLVWPATAYTQVMYILTLGIRTEYRRRGLARVLLRRCMAQARAPTVGAVYLHVLTTNVSAIRFYEANGFHCLRLLPEYYLIGTGRYDSFLYIRYVNGALDPARVSWVTGLLRPIVTMARSIGTWLLPRPETDEEIFLCEEIV